jgi:hypothetical protein
LHTLIGASPTDDYVASISDPFQAQALLSENWGFVRRETEAITEAIAGEKAPSPPRDYHELQVGGRRSWVYSTADGRRASLARLFCVDPTKYERADLRVVALVGLNRVPVLFVAFGDEAELVPIRETSEGSFDLRTFTLHDFRGRLPRSQDPTFRRLGEGLAHPLLPVPAEPPSQLPSIRQLPSAG